MVDLLEESLDAIVPPVEMDPLCDAQCKSYVILILLQCTVVRNEVTLGNTEYGDGREVNRKRDM